MNYRVCVSKVSTPLILSKERQRDFIFMIHYAYMNFKYCTDLFTEPSAPVAFHAYAVFSDSRSREFNSGNIIPFEGILLNEGNHFSSTSSRFVCPFEGIYLFAVSAYSDVNHYMHASIVHENDEQTQMFADDGEPDQGAVTAVIRCNRGERVFVQCKGLSVMYAHVKRNSFSGVLLYKL